MVIVARHAIPQSRHSALVEVVRSCRQGVLFRNNAFRPSLGYSLKMPSRLHDASQVIHLDHLRPATKLFVRSVVRSPSGDDAGGEDQWDVWVFALLDGTVTAWVGRLGWDAVSKLCESCQLHI